MSGNQYPYGSTWEREDWTVPVFPGHSGITQKFPVEYAVILLALLTAIALGWGALGLYGENNGTPVPNAVQTDLEENASIDNAPIAPPLPPPEAIIAPYDQYILTQGVHGLSYGHMAIDIAAGKGTIIKSPISGRVSSSFVDAVGNPTLIIENDLYEVTMLHGIYTVKPGDILKIGDEIGAESNQGNTRDMQGRSCRNRDCGYHTHLNIFNKITQENIDPLTVIDN